MTQHVVVTEYNPLWTNMFETEAAKIKSILGENCRGFRHMCEAKPHSSLTNSNL